MTDLEQEVKNIQDKILRYKQSIIVINQEIIELMQKLIVKSNILNKQQKRNE